MSKKYVLQTRGLTKSYARKRAVDGVDIAVVRGGITGFMGPNGAGKTTFLNMVVGLMKPDAGEVTLLGRPNGFRDPNIRRRIGYLQEKPGIYPDMTVREYLSFFAALHDVPSPSLRIRGVLERVSLTDAAHRRLSTCSRGMRQRACLARTLLHGPEFVILDEPTLDLDPNEVGDMRRIFRELGDEGVTLLFSSRQFDEMEEVCDNIVFLRAGQVVAAGPKDGFVSPDNGKGQLLIEFLEPVEPQLERIRATAGVRWAEEQGTHTARIVADFQEAMPVRDMRGKVAQTLTENGLTVLSVTQAQLSLEDLYMSLTGMDAAEGQQMYL